MRIKATVICLCLTLCFSCAAYAEHYEAIFKAGNATISINNGGRTLYKQGDRIELAADDLICLHAGTAIVTIKSSTDKHFSEQITKPDQCQMTPSEKEKKGWFSSAKVPVSEVGKEGMPNSLAENTVTASQIKLGGDEYFVLENISWHKNRRTFPLSLQITNSSGEVLKEYISNQKGTTLFVVPLEEIEETKGQSYALKVLNKTGSELLEPTRFSLNITENDATPQETLNENMALQLQLQYQQVQLKNNLQDLGSEHPEVANLFVSIGLIYSQLGSHSAAIRNLSGALELRKKIFGINHPLVATTYSELGRVYEKMGLVSEAEMNKQKAVEIWQSSLGRSRGSQEVIKESEKVYYDKSNHTLVDVLFGTDRQVNQGYKEGDSKESYYTGERGKLQYGLAQVSIPKLHESGAMERPAWYTKETVGEHVVVTSLEDLGEEQFLGLINDKLGNVKDNDILVFIHGYNVSFASAVRRTAQLSYDLDFKGVPLTYSWPSKSETDEYWTDEASIQYTVPHLVTFLKGVIENNRENHSNIHIIGHSMGTRALGYAVKELSLVYDEKPLFKNIIFAAPDIDQDVFEVSIFPYVQKTAEKITLYASVEDSALQLSASMHGGMRVGQGGEGVFIFHGLDTIDASGIDTDYFSLSHSYFSEKALVVADIKDIVYKSLPPTQRKSLIEKSKDKLAYWVFNLN